MISGAFGQEIENGGFENWSSEVLFENPQGWFSSNYEFGDTDANVSKATDAAVGEFSAFMGTTEVDGELNFGFVMNGSFGDDGPESGFPYSGMVDGLKCSMKWDIQPGDSATVLMVAFNQGNIVGMNVTKPVGVQSEWQTVAVNLPSPVMVDEVLVAFASSNAMEDFGVEDSWIMVDYASLRYQDDDVYFVPNGDFEVWDEVEEHSADGWQSNALVEWDMVTQSDDAFLGNSSLRMENVYNADIDETAYSYLTNGEFTDNGFEGGQVISESPESVYGHFKYQPNGVDTAIVYFEFFSNDVLVGDAWVPLTAQSNWTGFEQEINYWNSDEPDMFRITAYPGEESSSVLWLDELSFTFVSSIPSLNSISQDEINVYPNPFDELINIQKEIKDEILQLEVYSTDGKLIWEYRLNRGENDQDIIPVNLSHIDRGLYQLSILTEKGRITKTIAKY